MFIASNRLILQVALQCSSQLCVSQEPAEASDTASEARRSQRLSAEASHPAATIWKQGTRVRDTYCGSPGAALQQLPEGLHIQVASPMHGTNTLTVDPVSLRLFSGGSLVTPFSLGVRSLGVEPHSVHWMIRSD